MCHMEALVLELLSSCSLFVRFVIHFKMCSWRSRDARPAAEAEEGTPIPARNGSAAGDQEIPEIHRTAYPICTRLVREITDFYSKDVSRRTPQALLALQEDEMMNEAEID